MADFTVFSFHAVKNLTTAEGGGICINLPEPFDHAEVYKLLNTLSLHGQNKDALAKYGKKGNWEYDVIDAGFKCNMTDVLSSIGLIEFERYETETLPKRKQIFLRYVAGLRTKEWAIVPDFQTEDRESSYHLFLLRIKNASREQRDAIIEKIFQQDVSVNVHYKPLPLLSFYKSLGYQMEAYSSAKRLWENEISLPVYYDLTEEQVDSVLKAVTSAVESVLK
jgi:dTDP-4-amino-4,6-dideoxygalactose transaminase